MIDKNAIDNNALHYYRKLKEAGFSAYFVGGSVRDLLLGKRPKDFDIATNATPQQIRRVTGGRIIGRRFRHVMLERDGGRYEIVTFRGPVIGPETEEPEDDSDAPETENKRKFPDLNQFGTAEQDALRRLADVVEVSPKDDHAGRACVWPLRGSARCRAMGLRDAPPCGAALRPKLRGARRGRSPLLGCRPCRRGQVPDDVVPDRLARGAARQRGEVAADRGERREARG
ncbi:MAG: hypothetical protein HUU37_09440, partial [Bdellovibrionales bacterium]|nr:hypothetical protein [Bdellovibrionales bacterium]